MTDKLQQEVHGHVLRMTFNRPTKKNAVDLDMLRGLVAAYTRLSDDAELRCGVLHGEGDVFTAGLDLAAVLPRFVSDGPSAYLEEGQVDPFGMFGWRCAKPVIVAPHGRCYTAGLELTLAADMCVAAQGTVFGQMEVRRGIFPFGGATFRLPARIGWSNAMRYILAGDTFTAEEGQRMGLVQVVTEPGRHLEEAMAMADRVAANAPLAVEAALANARLFEQEGLEAAVTDVQKSGRAIAATADAREGMMSLMQKRAPVFTGK